MKAVPYFAPSLILVSPMKSAILFIVCHVATASAILRPTYEVKGTRECSSLTTTTVEWFAATEMGGDAWVFQLEHDGMCAGCGLLKHNELKTRPMACSRCVVTFWQQMQRFPACWSCRYLNVRCNHCQKMLRKLHLDEKERLRHYAKPFLSHIRIQ